MTNRTHGFSRCIVALTGLLSMSVAATSAQAQSSDAPFRIVVIDDMSGIYSGNGGPGTVLGATMARQYIEQQNVSAIVSGGASSVGLAVQAIARDRKKTTLVSGGYASNFSGDGCSP